MAKETSRLIIEYLSLYKNYNYRRKTNKRKITFCKTSIFGKRLNTRKTEHS